MYGADPYWCTRFRRAGWEVRCGLVTTLRVKGATAGLRRRLRLNAASSQPMGRYFRRHLPGEHELLETLLYASIGIRFSVSACGSLLPRTVGRDRR